MIELFIENRRKSMYIQGTLNNSDVSVKTYDWKVFFGRSYHIHHLNVNPGLGFCYSRTTYGADCQYQDVETRIDTDGPIIFLCFKWGLTRYPLEWYLHGTWMFADVDEEVVYREGEHLQFDI